MLETEYTWILLVEFHSSVNFSVNTLYCFNFQDYPILLINGMQEITQQARSRQKVQTWTFYALGEYCL